MVCEWLWPAVHAAGHALLQLLRILTQWQVVLAFILILGCRYFKQPLENLIQSGRFQAKWHNFEATLEAQNPQSGTGPIKPISDTSSSLLVPDASVTASQNEVSRDQVIERLTSEREGFRAEAWRYFFLWLESFLVVKTKSILYWIADNGPITTSAFRIILAGRAAYPGEAEVIEKLLLMNRLIKTDELNVQIDDSGTWYINWRAQSNLVPPTPLADLAMPEKANPVVPNG